MVVIDVSDPTSPFQVGSRSLSDSTINIVESDGLVYVAATGAGMEILGEVPMFADGFESGDTSAWSTTAP